MEIDECKPMIYHIEVITNDYPRHPLELDMMIQIRLFNGCIMQRRVTENLGMFIGMNESEVFQFLSSAVSCRLIEDLQKDLQHNIAQMIYNKIGRK